MLGRHHMPSAEHTAGVMLVMYHAIANVEVTHVFNLQQAVNAAEPHST